MSTGAVQSYLRSVLDGQVLPVVAGFTIPPLQAIVGPPTVGTPKGPQIYIRVRRYSQTRKSQSPGSGTLETIHDVMMITRYQVITTNLAEAGTDPATVFSAIVDTIVLLLNRQPKAHIIVNDPYTGMRSELGLIGDAQSGELQGPWAVQDQRMQLYGATMAATVKELQRG